MDKNVQKETSPIGHKGGNLMDIIELTVHELQEKLKSKELTITEVVEAYTDRINEKEKDVQAFVTNLTDKALEQAKEIEKKIDSKEISGDFVGIPIGIKDNICTKGVKTTCSSRMLENFVAPYNATVMEKINSENMINLGKLNMDEFAMGGSTEHSYFKKTKNPWDFNKVPGGSSGGSAAAVAAGMVPWALGSDTGGSIRQPASYNGVVGIKPTYGRVSRYGVVAYASSIEQVGPFTKNVKDNAYMLSILSGGSQNDETSLKVEVPDYLAQIKGNIKGVKVGVLKEVSDAVKGLDVEKTYFDLIEFLKENGAEIVYTTMPHFALTLPCYYIIAPAEASSNLGRFDGIKYSGADVAPETYRR